MIEPKYKNFKITNIVIVLEKMYIECSDIKDCNINCEDCYFNKNIFKLDKIKIED